MKTIAALQMASGSQVQANLLEAGRLIKEAAAQGAGLAVLPETFAIIGQHDQAWMEIAENWQDGLIQDFIRRQAQEHQVWILAGTIPIKSAEPDDPRPFAASVLYNEQGEEVGRYDKMHLFDVEIDDKKNIYQESRGTAPGLNPVVVDSPFGKLGLSVCYDLRFPELFRCLVAKGAEILLVPSAFTDVTGQAHWEPLLRARAIENLCYVVAPAQGGYHVNGRTTYGHSMVIDYWGRICGQLAKAPGIVLLDVDLDALHASRQRFPVLKHRYPPGTFT